MYLEELQDILDWDYCKRSTPEPDEVLYQFGFKDGVHFYLSEYSEEDELGKFLLSLWKDRTMLVCKSLFTFNEVLTEINKELNK